MRYGTVRSDLAFDSLTYLLHHYCFNYHTNSEFVWDVVQFDNDVRWNIKYEELKEFVRINGHAVVPQSTPLGQWVKMQRENKKGKWSEVIA